MPSHCEDANTASGTNLSKKVDYLFKSIKPRTGEFSYEFVATSIREAGGPTISAAYIWMLRKGQRDNPTMKHIEALAHFFHVPPSYFFEHEVNGREDRELVALALLSDTNLYNLVSSASGLSTEAIQALTAMTQNARRIEGLSDAVTTDETSKQKKIT